MTIGELAKQAGVNIQTIRFYERHGLVPEPGAVVIGGTRSPVLRG